MAELDEAGDALQALLKAVEASRTDVLQQLFEHGGKRGFDHKDAPRLLPFALELFEGSGSSAGSTLDVVRCLLKAGAPVRGVKHPALLAQADAPANSTGEAIRAVFQAEMLQRVTSGDDRGVKEMLHGRIRCWEVLVDATTALEQSRRASRGLDESEDPKSPAAIDSALHFAVAFSQRVVLLVLMRFVQKQKGREALAALLAARNSAGKTVFEEAEEADSAKGLSREDRNSQQRAITDFLGLWGRSSLDGSEKGEERYGEAEVEAEAQVATVVEGAVDELEEVQEGTKQEEGIEEEGKKKTEKVESNHHGQLHQEHQQQQTKSLEHYHHTLAQRLMQARTAIEERDLAVATLRTTIDALASERGISQYIYESQAQMKLKDAQLSQLQNELDLVRRQFAKAVVQRKQSKARAQHAAKKEAEAQNEKQAAAAAAAMAGDGEKLVVLSTPLAKAAIRGDPMKSAAVTAASAATSLEGENAARATGGRYDTIDSEQQLEQLREERIEELLDNRPRCRRALRALAGECARLRIRLESHAAISSDAGTRSDGEGPGSRRAAGSKKKTRQLTIETYEMPGEEDDDDVNYIDEGNQQGFLASLVNDLLEVLAPVPPAEKLRLRNISRMQLNRSQAASTSALSSAASGSAEATDLHQASAASSGTSRNVSPPAGVPGPQPSPAPTTPRQLSSEHATGTHSSRTDDSANAAL